VGGREIVLWDVLGLHKGDEDREQDTIVEDAAKNLHHMVQRLQGGVNLLVHCINSKRPSEAVETNYEAFYLIIGSKKAPIVLVVTGLEDEDPMEGWRRRNEEPWDEVQWVCLHHHDPLKNGHEHRYDEQYEQSRQAVRELIKAKLGAPFFI